MSYLKDTIDRILGSSLRCLLPSYWWKRIFGLLVEEIDGKASRTVEDKVRVNAASISNLRSRVSELENNVEEDAVPHILLYVPTSVLEGVPQWDNAKYTALNAAALQQLGKANAIGKEGYTIQVAAINTNGSRYYLNVERMYFSLEGKLIVITSQVYGGDAPDFVMKPVHIAFAEDGSVEITNVNAVGDDVLFTPRVLFLTPLTTETKKANKMIYDKFVAGDLTPFMVFSQGAEQGAERSIGAVPEIVSYYNDRLLFVIVSHLSMNDGAPLSVIYELKADGSVEEAKDVTNL